MTTIFKKFATGTAVFALTATVFAGSTFAAGTGVNSVITGGEFTLSDISATAFSSTELDGTIQDSTASLEAFTITDARGTGAGWNVSIGATAFTNAAAPEDLKSLSPNTLTIAAPEVTGVDGSSLDTNIAKVGGVIDNGTIKMLTAAEQNGMGTYNVSDIPMNLNLKPSEVYAGTYTSTITVALTTGP